MFDFGKRLRYLRKQGNLSQKNLAKKAKVSLSTIEVLEKSKRLPTLYVVEKITLGLDISLYDFFLDKKTRENNLTLKLPNNQVVKKTILKKILKFMISENLFKNQEINDEQRIINTFFFLYDKLSHLTKEEEKKTLLKLKDIMQQVL